MRRVKAVQLPSGRVVKRTSKTKDYVYVVIAEAEKVNQSGVWEWVALRWSESAQAAQNAAAGFDHRPYLRNVRVVDV